MDQNTTIIVILDIASLAQHKGRVSKMEVGVVQCPDASVSIFTICALLNLD